MAGIYIHIPFCKQACHYCDFHFSTSTKHKADLLKALQRELVLRKDELQDSQINTIYFGGGTPSLLSRDELKQLLESVFDNYQVVDHPEITLEANPDDLSHEKIIELSHSQINRLSIGIQSFFDEDLKFMNRAHSADQAKSCLDNVKTYFNNVTIDLIYGIQGQSDTNWQANLEYALAYDIPHISSYALTVEPKTALASFIKKGEVDDVDEAQSQRQFMMMINTLEAHEFVHYEISNFGKPGFFSKHNKSYWQGQPYLGIGPSAHSYDGVHRSWNISNNSIYIQQLQVGNLPSIRETLSQNDRFNEKVMTGLRTIEGVSVSDIALEFGIQYRNHLLSSSEKFVSQDLLLHSNERLVLTKKGKFLADGIASELFMID